MSKLNIVASPAAIINPMFSGQFALLAESDKGHAAELMACMPLRNYNELPEENQAIQSMAMFMLLSGSLMGVKWGDKYYFGDVDLMDMHDNYLDDEGTIVLQHELEDELLKCILCEKDIDEELLDRLPNGPIHRGCRTKLRAFQATGKDFEDVRPYNEMYRDSHDVPVPGRAYLVAKDIGLIIESTSYWADDNRHKALGAWYLVLGNQEYISDDIEMLEQTLYSWAQSGGWCDHLGLAASWDKWHSGGGYYIWSHNFMDGKSIHVTDECFILSSLPTEAHRDMEYTEATGSDYLLAPVYFDCPMDKDKLAFTLVPFIGQELADMIAADICFIVENWNL